MAFYKHQSTTAAQPEMQRLLSDYGYAGYGFYWRLLEEIIKNDGKVTRAVISAWRIKGLKTYQITKIISSEYGLFQNDNAFVSLADIGVRAGVPTSVRTGDDLCPRAVPCSEVLKKDKRDNIRAAEAQLPQPEIFADEEAELFHKQMKKRYPHIMKLDQPLTLQEYRRAVNKYGRDMVNQVIADMENHRPLLRKYHSANLTLQNWCRLRISPKHHTAKN